MDIVTVSKKYVDTSLLLIFKSIFGLNALELTDINIFFDGWWTLFIIVPCFIGLFKDKEKTSNLIGLIIGLCLLLGCLDILEFAIIWKLMVPAILVMIGLSFVFKDTINLNDYNNLVKITYDILLNNNSKEEIQNAFLTREYVILAPGTLYRKEWLDNNQLRFRPNPYSEDQLFVWECLLHIGKIAVVKSDLYNYLDRPGSIMTSSKYQKIIAAYPFFKELERQYQMSNQSSALAKRFLLPRWVGGIFHSAAKLCNYKEYTFLLDSFEASIHLKELKSFPNIKIKLLSMVFFVSKRLYYLLNRAI